ncbi:hypothetical protein KUTG_08493 [Kutzneria sp. 744]|nr:hypothetical protein KUTG_08493 [Kutzneria sp. 744]
MLRPVTTLMMYAGAADAGSTSTRTGGLPLLPADAEWPICGDCEGPQQFLAHVPLPDGPALAVFMCANDPGMCDAWKAGSGANAVVFTGHKTPLAAPEKGVTGLDDVTAITLRPTDIAYDYPLPGEDVLGQFGGEPMWIQDPETPDCPECGTVMGFVLQLEPHSSINFGAGAGYVFCCRPCERGEFLFQC